MTTLKLTFVDFDRLDFTLDGQQGGNFEAGEAKFFPSPEIEVFYD